ncbi:hypothetical protein NBO_448g0002 [Nosema bombycis CQ1]|uniref:Uncharacterized protein n=1 Tax=Nosema bombycis (strain CQ1 / CVCC 102059) TaxID=578461 RepID=R0MEA6_NOSB1|nr:hypothetical protein NBO_448g0002 [Nosema bombycis CQ1]|eukprot:EOB12405.1 hypothetical protein NBO_448g0002 [Nosema bombycis CQ1]
MSLDSEEENKFLLPKYKFIFIEGIGDDDKIDLVGNNKALNHYKIYENCNLKKHKKDYAFIEVIDLKDYPNPFFFSRTRVLLLLDDLLGVDVMCIGDYHPFESQNDLKYILGHDEQSFLSKAIIHCKEILKETFTFENTMVLKTWDNKKLARIYIKDFDLKENTTTVDAIKEAIRGNESLKGIDIKIRGRNSEYIEPSMNGVSPENTYIQIVDTDVNFYLNECVNLLSNLRRFLI